MKITKSLFGILTITAALAIQVHAQTLLTNGLVAYYPFNGNANDESGNGNDGTIVGATATADRFGVVTKAYRFNGTSDYIQVGDKPQLRMTTALTISTWINPNKATDVQMIVNKEGEYWFGVVQGKLSCALATSDSSLFAEYDTTTLIPTARWTHVVMSFNAGNLALYVNKIGRAHV